MIRSTININSGSGLESHSYSGASWYSYSKAMTMAEPIFDHDRLDVYRLSIDYVASSFSVAKDLNGLHRHVRDQWLCAHRVDADVIDCAG